MRLVLDASIGAKWLIEEPDSRLAEKVLNLGEALIVPDLFAIEVAAAVTKRYRAKQITSLQLDIALDRLDTIIFGALVVESTSRLVARSARMSRDLHHSLYDCVYLALAESLGTPLVTADRTFVRKSVASEWSGIAIGLDELSRLALPT